MAEETILKVLCGNHGSMDYERLLDISYGLKEISAENSLDHILRRGDIFTVLQRDESREVFAQTTVKLCRKVQCDELCEDLHLCKYKLMMGHCRRPRCSYGHQLMSEHNVRVLRAHGMLCLSLEDLCVLLLQSDSGLLPPVCVAYNRGGGSRGGCPDGEKCARLHVCESFVRRRCGGSDCERSHDFHEPQTRKVLLSRGVSNQLMIALPFIYRNILALKTLTTRAQPRNTDVQPHSSSGGESELCLSFIRGFCGADKCSKTHSKMPYKWEVKVGRRWHDLPNSEQVERDYCDPYNTHSSGKEPVCFEDMTLGLDEVRRLSTQSSVLLPGFALTTRWSWFWKSEDGRWIQYGSVAEMHRMSSVSSEQLEHRYQECLRQEQEDAGIKFRAGNRFYELHFTDMKQRNEVSGTERPVRRRPVFVSSVDVQTARARCCSTIKTHFSKGVPGFWDQTAIPDFGFQRVRLRPNHRDYVRVHERFRQTLSGFTVRQIERVQNRELWEDFMIKKERMKVANKQEKCSDRLLFRATEPSLVEAVCLRNFDSEPSETAAYGQGIYFSKEARYWTGRADGCVFRLMFACRVLVGYYTRGAAHLRQPPTRNAEGSLYDSCVDDPRDPSVFVVFNRCQIYPEYLITYEDTNKCSPCGIAQENAEQDSSRCTSSASPDSDPEHTSSSSRRTEPLITLLSSTFNTDTSLSTALPVSTKSVSAAFPVSSEDTSTALPVSTKSVSAAFPVSSEDTSTALPVSTKSVSAAFPVSPECNSTTLPLSSESSLNALPVLAECISIAFPFSTEYVSIAHPLSTKSASTPLPVISESALNALPVSTKRISTALPLSSKSVWNAFPVSTESASTALPVSTKCTSTPLPVSRESASNALPVTSGSASTALPVSTKCTSTPLPVSRESASNTLPVSTKCTSTPLPVSRESVWNAFPVTSGSASTALPVSTKCTSTQLPVSGESALNVTYTSRMAVNQRPERCVIQSSTGNSSAAVAHRNLRKPAAQKKSCAVM